MKPITHISSLLALAAVAVAASPAGAAAQAVPQPERPRPQGHGEASPTPFVAQPIMATGAAAKVSIGNRTIAWAVHDEPRGSNAAGTTVWTLRDGKPVVAAKLPSLDSERLEAGTDASGNPVAIVSDAQEGKPTSFYLARLDTGQVRQLALGRHARSVEDVAVDAGRVLYSTSARGHTKRARSSLWTARLDGRALTTPTRLRRSRLGMTFETVRADRRRIAVTEAARRGSVGKTKRSFRCTQEPRVGCGGRSAKTDLVRPAGLPHQRGGLQPQPTRGHRDHHGELQLLRRARVPAQRTNAKAEGPRHRPG